MLFLASYLFGIDKRFSDLPRQPDMQVLAVACMKDDILILQV